VFLDKDRTRDNIQQHNIYNNIIFSRNYLKSCASYANGKTDNRTWLRNDKEKKGMETALLETSRSLPLYAANKINIEICEISLKSVCNSII
jgi:hypothetical protein